MSNLDIGNRMKTYYEGIWNVRLPMRMPVIIRLDGRAFHTLTKSCEKPFDESFISVMDQTAIALCNEIAGA